MDKNSKSKFLSAIKALEENALSSPIKKVMIAFYESFHNTIGNDHWKESYEQIFLTFLSFVCEQYKTPYKFESYHKMIREPFDYHAFSLDFFRPLILLDKSIIKGREHLSEATEHLNEGHNVIFFANHQIEADPYAISLLLESTYPKIAEEIIFIAGERVTTDPFAVPFSKGCNLLCIYSKRYIDHPPENKLEKQLHNKKTMRLMSSLLSEGGKCIYVAPSGGRDRRGSDGKIKLAPFDAPSIEMFNLMAKRAKKPTFFYPMALSTYDLMPPPKKVQRELGEIRIINRVAIHLAVGKKIDMDHFPGSENSDKHYRRKCRSDYIWDLVKKDYETLEECT